MNKWAGLFIAIFLAISWSCHTPHIVQTTPLQPGYNAILNQDSVTSIFLKVRKKFFDFNTFSCKAKVSYSDQKNGVINFSATIRMKKDSVIWISISPGMGIEVYRIMVTKDSIRILDRLHKSYISRGVDYVGQFVSYPVNLREMQKIIAGVPIGYHAESLSATKGDSSVLFASIDSDWNSNILVNNKDFLIHQFLMQNTRKQKKLMIEFYNYNYDNAFPFSLDRYMEINNPDPITISVDYSKIKINDQLRFPFNNKYE
jgi:hypothetical protein